MKRNVLLLINGFGIEQVGSYNIYSAELMPNLERLTKERLFASIPCSHLDYKSGYRNFSIGINKPLTYSIIENSISSLEYEKNNLLNNIIKLQKSLNNKIHIICFYENEKTIEHLLTYIKYLLTNINNQIIVHLVLCQKSLSEYKNMQTALNKINYENADRVKLCVVTGENLFNKSMNLKDIVRSLLTGSGEKWKDTSKKISVLNNSKTLPINARTFVVNENLTIEEKDIIFFFNYNNIDINQLKKEIEIQKYKKIDITKLHFCSLFSVKCDIQIPFMYNYAVSSTCISKTLSNMNIKCLVLDTKERCSYINYYMTGLRNNIEPFLNYLPTDDNFIYNKNKLLEIFTKYNHEFIIINYEVESSKNVEELKERLKTIDDIIGTLSDYLIKNEAALFISSFYGIEKELYNNKQELCKINFSKRVPLIVVDNLFSKKTDMLIEGNLYDLSISIFSNICGKFKNNGIIRKKPSLLSIFNKK